jgi:hypothetical protein
MADTSDIDAALAQKLAADPVLAALLPGGVWWDVAAASTPPATKFVIVSQVEHDDVYALGLGGRERIVYLVKAVTKGNSGTEVRAAAKRIHAVLQDQPLEPDGYKVIVVQRIQRLPRHTEIDEATDERWQHRGGHYEIQACPIVTP